jgi:hypothetical protein
MAISSGFRQRQSAPLPVFATPRHTDTPFSSATPDIVVSLRLAIISPLLIRHYFSPRFLMILYFFIDYFSDIAD